MSGIRFSELDALLLHVNAINEERNDVIHALWVRDMEGTVIRIRTGKRLPADAATVLDLVARARSIRDQINDYPWTQPDRHHER